MHVIGRLLYRAGVKFLQLYYAVNPILALSCQSNEGSTVTVCVTIESAGICRVAKISHTRSTEASLMHGTVVQ